MPQISPSSIQDVPVQNGHAAAEPRGTLGDIRFADERRSLRDLARSPLRILIADRREVARVGLRATLERRSGWQVVAEAGNGQDAIAAVADTKVDVAIVDTSLPLLDGIEVTRRIRAQRPEIDVLVFATHDSGAIVRGALRAGARAVLLKSDGEDDLIAAVGLLRRSRAFIFGRFSRRTLQNAIGNKLIDLH